MIGEIFVHKKEEYEIKGKKYYMLDITGEGISGKIKTSPKVYEFVKESKMYFARFFIKNILDKYDKPKPCIDMIIRVKESKQPSSLYAESDIEMFAIEQRIN